MKVKLRDTIMKEIINAHTEALTDGREIEYIELTRLEYKKFKAELRGLDGYLYSQFRSVVVTERTEIGMFDGVRIIVEQCKCHDMFTYLGGPCGKYHSKHVCSDCGREY